MKIILIILMMIGSVFTSNINVDKEGIEFHFEDDSVYCLKFSEISYK